MQTKLFWLGLALATVVTCRLGAWLYNFNAYCQPHAGGWGCHERAVLADISIMVLPLGVLILRGVYVGLRQLQHTQQAVHRLLALDTSDLPHDVLHRACSLAIAERIDVVQCSRAEAFCYGLLHPRICITTGLLTVLEPAEVEAVLRHERHHLQRRDPLRSLLWTMLCSVCWGLEERAAHADLVRELAADRAVIEEQGRAPLAHALLKLVTHLRDDSLSGLAVSGLSVTDARIDQLLQPDQQSAIVQAPAVSRWIFAPLALLTYLIVCSVMMAHP